jgi:hypothetical protein
MEQEQSLFFTMLPAEIILHSIGFVDEIITLGRLVCVCSSFHKYVDESQSLWKNLCKEVWKSMGFDHYVDMDIVYSEFRNISKQRDWRWFARCFAWEELQSTHTQGFKLVNGWLVFGEMKSSKLNGFGVQIFLETQQIQVGSISEDRMEGSGLTVWKDGGRYSGNFKEGVRSGQGSFRWAAGNSYEGEWCNGLRNGIGTFVWNDGEKYEGMWRNDDREGHGKWIWPDGDTFEGEWKAGEKNGPGVMNWNSAKFQYSGNWVDGMPEDENLCLHPFLKNCIEKNACTSMITGTTLNYGQFYYNCKDCEGRDYCVVCWKSCHHFEGHKFKRRWSDGIYCDCIKSGDSSCFRQDHTTESHSHDTSIEN